VAFLESSDFSISKLGHTNNHASACGSFALEAAEHRHIGLVALAPVELIASITFGFHGKIVVSEIRYGETELFFPAGLQLTRGVWTGGLPLWLARGARLSFLLSNAGSDGWAELGMIFRLA
jgi:hypothetical protein